MEHTVPSRENLPPCIMSVVEHGWGVNRIGRLEPFIWQDSGEDYSSLYSVANMKGNAEAQTAYEKLLAEGALYTEAFNTALQKNQSCVQHHMHKKNTVCHWRAHHPQCLQKRPPKNGVQA